MSSPGPAPASDAGTATDAKLLAVSGLRTHYRTRAGVLEAVTGISFDVERGSCLGIVGESGCGKSAVALSIMRLLPENGWIAGGRILFAGQDLAQLGERELTAIRGAKIGMVFQDPMTSLHPGLTIGRQIGEVLKHHLHLPQKQARERARDLLGEVEIANADKRLDAYPHHLSGGMRQRVMIAIAIACRPRLLIADEPTTALDVSVQAGVLDLLDDLRRRYEMGLVLITHDMGVIAQMTDEVVVMYAGQVVERASTAALFAHPEHPYTEALLGALPQIDLDDARTRPLVAIPGQPPVLIAPTSGCRFAPRCPHLAADDGCEISDPPLREIRPGHWVRTQHPASARAAVTAGAN